MTQYGGNGGRPNRPPTKNMTVLVPLESGRLEDANTVLAADALLEAKKTKPFWEVVEQVINFWANKEPRAYRSYLVELDSVRNTRSDPKFATAKGDRSQPIRYIADVPEFVTLVLRKLYDTDELEMDKRCFHDFVKHFPAFKVAQKL